MRHTLIACFLMALTSSVFATGNPPHLTIQALGAVMSRAVLTYPLREKIYQSKLAISRVTNNSNDSTCSNCNVGSGSFTNDMKGNGFTTALTYGFNNHWGASLLAGYTSITGTRTLSLRDDNGALLVPIPARMGTTDHVNGADGKGHGFVATVSAVWDHWDGDEFRFPLYLGAGVMSIKEEADATNFGIKRTADVFSPAILVGMAPSMNMWKFRAVAFFMIVAALDPGKGTIEDYRLGTKTEIPLVGGLDSAFPIAGVELTYQPLGIGLSYSPDITSEGAKSVALKWSAEWGGK